jgi:uncharacterized protein YcbK (DUF882 family)
MATRHRLSPHFVIEEFDCKDGTQCRDVDHVGLEYLCRTYLEPLRSKYGVVHVNSGYRSASYNAKIGGASKSFHIYDQHSNDQAADITCQNGTPREWHSTAAWIRQHKRNGRGGLGLCNRFVHIDLREYAANWRG